MTRWIVAALVVSSLGGRLDAQTLRIAGWGSYQGVTRSADWSTVGAQLTLATGRGHSTWLAAEMQGRFGETDIAERIGGVFHPAPGWWITAEAGTTAQPTFTPKNTWEADVTALVAARASLGVGYRRWNYVVGPVDVVMPHVSLQTRATSWDFRLFVSRNPSDRTDAAFFLRATATLSNRAAAWVLGGAGRESYVVGAGPAASVRALDTVTGAAGLRYNARSGVTLRIDASAIGSRPVLSRRGIGIGLEKQF